MTIVLVMVRTKKREAALRVNGLRTNAEGEET
jgi:hypothetical protein